MMCIAETFAVICADCIDDKQERKMVLENLKSDGKELIFITEDQVNNFAGNMLQVRGANDKRYLVMSDSAYNSLTKEQLAKIEKHTEILHVNLDSIEACGGGSARCMMAEVFAKSRIKFVNYFKLISLRSTSLRSLNSNL